MVWIARERNRPDYLWVAKLSRYEDMPNYTDKPEEETQNLRELQGHPNIIRVVGEFRKPCDPKYYW
jgi:chromatin segregation and condensation protein Rec8/ScpA/Scc1 (kleisin family)